MSIIVVEGSNGSGKSTIIDKITNYYDIVSMKSVPGWFREYIEFARSCPLKIQKEIYRIGHDANYFNCSSSNNYIFDRFIYTTIIRINYELDVSIEDTVNEILSYKNIPNILFVLRTNPNQIQKRLKERGNFYFDYDFYNYENKVFMLLSEKTDIIYFIDNNNNISSAVSNMCNVIDLKAKIRKR